MLDEIAQQLITKNGLLGTLLVASWCILGGVIIALWKVWRAEEKQWNEERTALYKESQAQEKDRFKTMLDTFQSVNTVLVEIKGAIKS
jgi:hypothetical protein